MVKNFACCDIKADGVISLDVRVREPEGAAIVGHAIWCALGSDIYNSRLGTNTNRLLLALNISSYFLPLTAKLAPNID